MTDPWNAPQFVGLLPDSEHVFEDQTELRLSELDVYAAAHAGLSAGHTVAWIHREGKLHGDVHAGNFLFDPRTGFSAPLDAPAIRERPRLDPVRMVDEFIVPRVSMSAEWMQALLAGYVKSSRMLIDPRAPGFTEAFLSHLGGRIVTVPSPRAPALDDVFTGDILDVTVGRAGVLAIVVQTEERIWRGGFSEPELASVLCALMTAGVDCSPLVDNRPESPPADPRLGLLHGLLLALHGHCAPSHDAVEYAFNSGLSGHFLAQLLTRRDLLRSGPGAAREQPSTAIIDALRETLRHGTPDEVRAFIDALVDVWDRLALRLDALQPRMTDNFRLSLQIAQLSWIVLQWSAAVGRLDEGRELMIAQRQADLSWSGALFAPKVDPEVLPHLSFYMHSRILAYMRVFRASGCGAEQGFEHALWSLGWRSLAMARMSLHRLLETRRGATDATELEGPLWEALRVTLATHAATIKATVEALRPLLETTAWARDIRLYEELGEECAWAADLHRHLTDHGHGRRDAREQSLLDTGLRQIDSLRRRFNFDELMLND